VTRVACEPDGCGWWWYRRAVRPHWWSRTRFEYDGAHFDGDGRGGGLRGQWLTAAQMADAYADCWTRIEQQQ
jgi:hypothetical protein